jgi:hypothetical protein
MKAVKGGFRFYVSLVKAAYADTNAGLKNLIVKKA